MKLTMLEFLVLDLLYNNEDKEGRRCPCTSYVTAMSIYELNIMELSSRSRATIQRVIVALLEKELINEGAKNGSAKTYYITKKGISQFEILLEEEN